MKNYILRHMRTLLAMTAVMGVAAVCASCQDDFDNNKTEMPVATIQPNTSILELKQAFWSDDNNYATEIGSKDDGSHYIIAGRVISSDEPGNVFKSLTIQDETAAMVFSINSYNLYLQYRVGQEVVVDVTGMYIGKYAGLMQIGMKEWTEKVNPPTFQVSFMSPMLFNSQAQPNGYPDAEKTYCLTMSSFGELGSTPEDLMKLQGQLVRFNNVSFQNGGTATFASYHETESQNLVDANGSTLALRTSGYCNFWNKTLPEGNFDIIALLGYFNSSYQLTLIDYADILNIGNPTVGPGSEDNPYTVEQALQLINNGTPASGWVAGYIVGTVAAEVTDVNANSDIEWNDNPETDNTIVIGATAETTDYKNCLVVEVNSGTKLFQYGVLANNPSNYKKRILIKGSFGKVMNMGGITGNNGSSSQFKIDGLEIVDGIPAGSGTKESPYNTAQAIAFNPTSKDTPAAGQGGVWVAGYIVGYMPTEPTTALSGTVFGASSQAPETNLVIAPTADCTDYNKCMGIQLNSSIRGALNLKANPANLGKRLDIKGDVLLYCGAPGVKNITEYTIEGGSVNPPVTGDLKTIYSESFASEMGKFTTVNAVLPEGLSYIWSIDTRYSCAKASAFVSGANHASDSYLISPQFDLTGATKAEVSFEHAMKYFENVQRDATLYVSVNGGSWEKVPINTYGDNNSFTFVTNTTDLSAYAGKKIRVAFRYISSDTKSGTWEIKNFVMKADAGTVEDGGDTPGGGDDPVTPSGDYKGDFNSFNDGKPETMSYSTFTNSTGWTCTNSQIVAGNDNSSANAAPNFGFIGDSKTLGPCMNGRKDRIGTIKSPVLAGGIKTLTFKYGLPYSDSAIKFSVKVLVNGSVVKEEVVTQASPKKFTAYDFSMPVNVSGNFSIEIVNTPDTPSDGKNGNRVAIWNLTWD